MAGDSSTISLNIFRCVFDSTLEAGSCGVQNVQFVIFRGNLIDVRLLFHTSTVEVTTSRKSSLFMYIRDLQTAITQKYSKEGAVHVIVSLNIHYVLGCKV